jgi:hypothetical protein
MIPLPHVGLRREVAFFNELPKSSEHDGRIPWLIEINGAV